jgi:hypothetical protein
VTIPPDPYRWVGSPIQRKELDMQSSNKAILAAVAAALASFIATVQGRTDLATMRALDWIIIVLSAVLAGLTVYAVPNRPTR